MPAIDGLSIDQIIDQALVIYNDLPDNTEFQKYQQQITELRERLAGGKLRLAVLGQFNRGKSTFINALLHLHVLPASVLPITSVPTVITYGARHRCTVTFLDDTPPQTAQDSLEEINDLLVQYVAEENNPQNRRQVSGVKVECSSSILHHGTVLIDTPGFGSTHIHNTQTTLDLLSSCDAALFLLSADLPITQLEVDFLKNVQKHVPRIFFIFNKTDLLGKEELEKTQNYIRGILGRELALTGDIRLFPVTAILAERSSYGDRLWITSGMETVKTEIIDFMLREKYFTLAEALNSKFRTALNQTRSLLDSKKQRHLQELHELKTRIKMLKSFNTEMQKEIEKERNLLTIEKSAFHERIAKAFSFRNESSRQKIHTYTEQLLADASLSRGQLQLIWNSLGKLTGEMLENILSDTIEAINRPLRNAESVHRQQINQLIDQGKQKHRIPSEYELLEEPTPEEVEAVRGECSWSAPPFPSAPEVKFPFFESTVKKRSQALQQLIEPLDQYWHICTESMSQSIHTLIDQAMDRLSGTFNTHYDRIESIQKDQLDTAQEKLAQREKDLAPRIEEMGGFAQRITEVEKLLV